MSTYTDAIQNPGKPGPRTPQGKAASSQNALKEGLFATHDFIRLGERDEYDAFTAAFRAQLAPEGPLEELFTAEIIGANWRLRRCRLIEEDLSARYDEIDPLQDDAGEKIQRSVDRARAHAQNAIRHALAEMRKLQTERHIRSELNVTTNYGLADFPKIVAVLKTCGLRFTPDPAPEMEHASEETHEVDSFCKTDSEPSDTLPANSFCDPGSEPCPCGSGQEYQHCCANDEEFEPELAA